jgi:lactoylglutathione lyase
VLPNRDLVSEGWTRSSWPGHAVDVTTAVRFEIFPTDLDATVDFWVRVLGFDLVTDHRAEGEDYVAMRRGHARIGAFRRDDGQDEWRRPPTGVEIVLEVDDVAGELARIRAARWPVAEDLALRAWGLWDFRVLDPSGHYVRITHRPG